MGHGIVEHIEVETPFFSGVLIQIFIRQAMINYCYQLHTSSVSRLTLQTVFVKYYIYKNSCYILDLKKNI